MSIDHRIKEGLTMIDKHLDERSDLGAPAGTNVALEDISRRARRTRTTRVTVGVLAAAVVALVVAVSLRAASPDGNSTPAPASPAASSSVDVSSAPAAASPLERTWRSQRVSLADMESNLRNFGLGRWVPALRSRVGDFRSGRVELRIRDGVATTTLRGPGGKVVATDSYTLSQNALELTPRPSGVPVTLEVRLQEGMFMSVVAVDATDAKARGVAWALYTTRGFNAEK
jgi:hypothetical protein